MDSQENYDRSKSIRKTPFCWQEKTILRAIRDKYEGTENRNLRNLYLTITEMDSDFNGRDIKYYTKTIHTYSGLNLHWIPTGLKLLEEMGIIRMTEDRENGQFKGKRLSFTGNIKPEYQTRQTKIEKETTVDLKTANGKTANGKMHTSEDSLLLEDSSIPNRKEKSVESDLTTFGEIEEAGKKLKTDSYGFKLTDSDKAQITIMISKHGKDKTLRVIKAFLEGRRNPAGDLKFLFENNSQTFQTLLSKDRPDFIPKITQSCNACFTQYDGDVCPECGLPYKHTKEQENEAIDNYRINPEEAQKQFEHLHERFKDRKTA